MEVLFVGTLQRVLEFLSLSLPMSGGVLSSGSSLGGGQIPLQRALEFLYPSLPIFVGVSVSESSLGGEQIGE